MYNLYIKQKVFKITDHYDVFDEAGNPVYRVDQDFTWVGHRVHVNKYDNSKSFTIERVIFTLMPKYEIKFSDGNIIEIQQRFAFFKKKIDLISTDYNLRLEGSFWDYNFEVYDDDELVGSIQKAVWSFSDTFQISVINPEYEEELLALMITVDNIQDMQRN